MKKKSYKIFTEDILGSVSKIERYIKSLDYNKFVKNDMVVDAVIRNLEIIGEAARNIPENVRKLYPEIPWERMIGLRNIVIHEYFGVDENILWEIIKKDIPKLKIKLEEILGHL